ncbi:MATE family efflux transporter [candidate division WOR-3 bacterium]|nr:MATE family efflux transporter [candidate division WOR-3 bacterium]
MNPSSEQPYSLRYLIALSWPIVLAFALQTSYNIVDIFWVGKLGPAAIAGVSLAGTTFYFVLAVGQIIGSGTVALVAQSYGARILGRAQDIVRQSLILTFGIAVAVSVLGFVFTPTIVKALGARNDVLAVSVDYLRIVCIGFFFQLLSFSINYAFRGIGDMITPMYIMLIATVINIILDPLLILGLGFFPRLEVHGAALATLIAKFLSFLFGLLILIKGKRGLKLNLKGPWHVDAAIARTILAVGIPAGVSYGLMFLSITAVFKFVASFSEYALAALGIGQRILQLSSLPVVGISVAVTTLVGQYLGAHNIAGAKRVSHQSMLVSSVLMAAFSVLFITQAGFFMRLFTDNAQVIAVGIDFLRIVSLYLIGGGLTIIISGIHRGAGDTIPPMLAGIIKLGLLVGLAFFFARILDYGVRGVWYALLISYIMEALTIVIVFMSGRWHKRGFLLLGRI